MSDDIRQPPAVWFTHPEIDPLDKPNQAVVWNAKLKIWEPFTIREVRALVEVLEFDPMDIADYVTWGGTTPDPIKRYVATDPNWRPHATDAKVGVLGFDTPKLVESVSPEAVLGNGASCDVMSVTKGDNCPECEVGGWGDADIALEERDDLLVCPNCGWSCDGY